MTRSAVWAATATALSTHPLVASPAAAGRSAATETPCAALATAAVTISVYPSLRACFHTTSHLWMSRTSCPTKTTAGEKMAKLIANLKVTRETPVCARPTVQTDTAVHGTSGPRSANQCCAWARCAPSRGRKALMVLRSSSAVTVQKASPVRCGKMPLPHPNPGSTCARRSEAQDILSAVRPHCCDRNTFRNELAEAVKTDEQETENTLRESK